LNYCADLEKVVVIVGGGRIGSLLASKMGTLANVQTNVVTGWKEHADKIQKDGLRTDKVSVMVYLLFKL
jgi:ketopantoate reductase